MVAPGFSEAIGRSSRLSEAMWSLQACEAMWSRASRLSLAMLVLPKLGKAKRLMVAPCLARLKG
jgi:hypothetical protein